tara:strand:- start:2248 stop:3774 length:1527 start_codon:yes stop_codon:yes gene_type:complete
MPAGDGISFTYGDYAFDPRPLFTVNKEIIKTPSNTGLATRYGLVLQGSLLPTGIDPSSNNKGGLTKVLGSGNALRDAFAQDFKLLKLQCDSDSPIISGYPKVISIDLNNADDNYIRRMDYTINLELPSLTGNASEQVGVNCGGDSIGDLGASGLISLSEDVTVEFLDERLGGDLSIFNESVPSVFSIQRNLSTQGNPLSCGPGSTYTEPWQYAKAYVENNLGLQPEMTGLSKLMCVSGMNIASSFRNISVNKTEGTVDASETFIAYTGSNPATEDFEVSVEKSNDSPFTNVSINGTIQGLANIDYAGANDGCAPTGTPKFNNAVASWSGISGLLLSRATSAYNTIPDNIANQAGSLNSGALSETIGYNPIAGSVTYSYAYNDRKTNYYSGALTEDIAFSYNEPNDVFSSLTILGRSQGPLFQAINTSGATTRDISINAMVPIQQIDVADLTLYVDGFTGYNDLISAYETKLSNAYQQVFINSHSETWDPRVGNYTLNKSYTVGYCVTS